MLKPAFITLILAILMLGISSSVWAFGQTGHRITGAIADHYLSESAKSELNKLLDGESLAEASTYIDEMRSHPSEFWQKTANPYHYVTVPKGKTYPEVGAPKKGDAVFALNKYTRLLKNKNASKKDKALAVKFIIHLIADLHQPLHVGDGTDRGGNDVKVQFFWEPSNLHRVWDSGLIDRQQLSYSEWTQWLLRTITPHDVQQWSSVDPIDWINESIEIREHIYPDTRKLDWDYQYQHLPTLKLRLKQAGIRIAHYFNALWP